jgi:uncharacterized RDD family membrane protein YckC
MNHQAIDSTQPVLLGQYAGFVTRLIGWIIDQLILAAVISIAVASVSFLLRAFPINAWLGGDEFVTRITIFVGIALVLAIPVIYNIGFWLLAGQTLGKWVMGVRIVRTDGERVRLGNCVRRQIGYVFSAFLFVGYLLILVDNRRQGLHDKLAGTFVVYTWPEQGPTVRPIRDGIRRFRFER